MRYLSPAQLPELTTLADRAQLQLASLLDDVERLPAPSVEYRLSVLDRITDFIYRLTAVRKTLVALRASMNPNLAGLRALTANIRSIHDQMLALKGDIRQEREIQTARDKLYASPSPLAQRFPMQSPCGTAEYVSACRTPGGDLGTSSSSSLKPGRFAPNWPPATDEIIPEPHLSDGTASPNPPATAHINQSSADGNDPGVDLACGTAALGGDLNSSDHPDASHSSHRSQSFTTPDPLNPSDPLTSLADSITSRIPASISDPDFQLPPSSNRAGDYAPLYDLDLVPHTPCVPTFPLNALDLAERITSQLDHIASGCARLHSSVDNVLSAGELPSQLPSDSMSKISASPASCSAVSMDQLLLHTNAITIPNPESEPAQESPPPRSHSP